MAVQDKGLTPMMKQFFSMKAKHPEALMLFRCGDFYETYGEDAVESARVLGIPNAIIRPKILLRWPAFLIML